MATTAKIAKEAKTPKFKIRLRNRCKLCGRPTGLHAQVLDVPSLLPKDGARGRCDRRDEEFLVVGAGHGQAACRPTPGDLLVHSQG